MNVLLATLASAAGLPARLALAPDRGEGRFDPKTLEYRAKGGDEGIAKATKSISKIEDPKERLRKLMADPGKAGQYAWKVLSRSLAYSARRMGEIADDVSAVDDAMKWGYNWELGPFEAWDASKAWHCASVPMVMRKN